MIDMNTWHSVKKVNSRRLDGSLLFELRFRWPEHWNVVRRIFPLCRFENAAGGMEGLQEVSMRAVAESLGSMGYFYGSSLVRVNEDTRCAAAPFAPFEPATESVFCLCWRHVEVRLWA